MAAPSGIVILAAGSGSRLAPLTNNSHKSLIPIAGKPALKWIIDSAVARGILDVVIVTGHRAEDIEAFTKKEYGNKVKCVFNSRYKDDVNILSVETGVNYLINASAGYMIIEADLVIAPNGWDAILNVEENSRSFWVTRGKYSSFLTGGALRVDDFGDVINIVYSPQYNLAYEGWSKLLGILYVGRGEAAMYQELCRAEINKSIAQYYMMPWLSNLKMLPCSVRDLGDIYAASYNDLIAYQAANAEYTKILTSLKDGA